MKLDWKIQIESYFISIAVQTVQMNFGLSFPNIKVKKAYRKYKSLKIYATVNQPNGHLKMFYHIIPCHLNCNQFKTTYVLTIIDKNGT